ncbi:protein SHORT HYPOCOTYL IN WHITE LIGHT 1 [Dendrobium catenatum]|nr:protein SHORT HYPOCOTYL IN WHITE LIGHT 1 [Dendrobium catenatum]
MATSSLSFFLSPPRLRTHLSKAPKDHYLLLSLLSIPIPSRFSFPLRASRKYPNYSKEAVVVVPDPRAWVGDFGGSEDGCDLDDDDDEEEDDDRSLDLFARLLQNTFRKISRQARRAVRSVLPPSISTKLVRFTVNGVLMLAFLWLLKAFLEVACMVGSMVFVSILLIRGIWSGLSYMKENQFHYTNRINKFNGNNSNSSWNGVQPVV